MTDYRIIYVTTRDASEAREIARKLLLRQQIACANILPQMESIYRWDGEVRQDSEAVLLLKTDAQHVSAVIEAVKELHSYDTPCALSLAIDSGSEEYLNWLGGELKS